MKRVFEISSTAILVCAAVLVAAASIHREFFREPTGTGGGLPANNDPVYVDEWRDMLAAGNLLGDPGSEFIIIEFADLECPFCRRFHEAMSTLRAEYDFALLFIHYPIPSHRFAMPAARAAECAGEQGRFAEFVDAVYSAQDQIGLITWSDFADQAGVPDAVSFSQCTQDDDALAIVDAGRALGERIGVRGTPTVIINGWRFPVPPYESLANILADMRDNVAPYDGE